MNAILTQAPFQNTNAKYAQIEHGSFKRVYVQSKCNYIHNPNIKSHKLKYYTHIRAYGIQIQMLF